MPAAASQPVRRYKLLQGKHCHGKNPDGSQRVFGRNDIITTHVDLLAFNSAVGSPKFALVDDDAPAAPAPAQVSKPSVSPPQAAPKTAEPGDDFDKMSVAELKTFAAGEEIDIPNHLSRKEEIVKFLRSTFAPSK